MSKSAFVTGGSGDIGSAICTELAKIGYNVAVGYNVSKENAEAVCKQASSYGVSAIPVKCNLEDTVSIKNSAEEVMSKFGRIDLLVNNAGTADIGLFTDLTDEKLFRLMNVNLLGTMVLTKNILPTMIREHQGKVVNISSVWGEKGASCEVAYSAAKAGLIGFTKALAREAAISGINVNCVSCGFIDTKMNGELSDAEKAAVMDEIPCEKMGTPLDVANAVCFLASEKSNYINGQILRVDGCWI